MAKDYFSRTEFGQTLLKVLCLMRLNTLKRAFMPDLLTYSVHRDLLGMGIDSRIIGLNNIGPRTLAILSQSRPHSFHRSLSLRRVRHMISEFTPDFILTAFEDSAIPEFGRKVVYWRVEVPRSDSKGGDRFSAGFAEKCALVFDAVMGGNEFLPLAVSPLLFHPVACAKTIKACFTGSWYPDREDGFKRMLYPLGKDVEVFGRDWTGREDGLTHHRAVDWSKLPGIYSSSHFCLDIHHPEVVRRGGANSRFFEIMASGGLLVSDETRGMEQLAEPGKEFIMVKEGEDIREVLDSYSDEERVAIAEAGRRRFLSEHTTMHRATRIIEAAKNL